MSRTGSILALATPWLALVLAILFLGWDMTRSRPVVVLHAPPAHAAPGATADTTVATDPVCRMTIRTAASHSVEARGARTWFCSTYCRDEYLAGAATQAAAGSHLMRGMPTGLLQTGAAWILVLSFGLFELVARRVRAGPAARFDLLALPPLRALAGSRAFHALARGVVLVAFLGVLVAGLFGNQNPALNIAPLLTWTIWWVGLVFLVLFLGKAWCYVCPWDTLARLASAGASLGLRWPSRLRNIWLAVGLFLLLTYVELGLGITMIPRATAWVGLAMVALAVAASLLFERKAFCRYACLVGRVSGLYALFGSLELRARDTNACGGCRTMDCYRGNARGEGCPTFEFPRTMDTSTYCILCTECVSTCPKDNIAINLRPWSSDLLTAGKPRADEAWLALILLVMTAFHGITMTPVWDRLKGGAMSGLGVSEPVALALWMALFIAAPVALFRLLAEIAARLARPHTGHRFFVEYAYAMLPIALFYHLAHNAEHFLMEGPKLAVLLSDPLGFGWNLFGTAGGQAAPLVTLEGLWMLQLVLVLIGHVYSLWISARITHRLVADRRRGVLAQLPMLAAMVLCSMWSLWLLNQPMTMRTSGM